VRRSYLLLTALGLAAPASAKPLDFSAILEGHAGYAINPRLDPDRTEGAGVGGLRFQPTLKQETSVSETTLGGDFEREEYTNSYGHTQSISATLDHSQSFSEHLHGDLNASYLRSNNILLGETIDPALLGDIANNEHVWHAQAAGTITWQMSGRDQISGGGLYAHEVADSFGFSRSYNQYGADFTYLHTLSARTKVGVRMNVSRFVTQLTGNSTSLSPAFVVQHAFSSIWKLDADVGVIIQRTGAPVRSTTTGVGFHANLCGTYPRSSLCVTVGRDTSATAFNGVRRQITASAQYSYRLSERSTLSAQVSYLHDGSGQPAVLSGPAAAFGFGLSSDVLRADIDYNRQLSERLSIGVDGRAGYRKTDPGSGHSISGTGYVRYRIG
jgi:hypothetical protein